ncbi:cell death activator CIDE-B [Ornithorhynchus anatinus]|uniref:Lipid transferase CIDEB n=1 Tax=Ornithorhynchus anatinus TaxID=9258 RepID=A0A6I8P5S5_ORNAN|nr:cell death activator CIDE-B [Ornithorhynchus anatinus]
MDSARDYVSALSPGSLLRSVSNVSSQLGRRVWSPAPPPRRPFRICDHKRATRKGLTAATRQELLDKATGALGLSGAPAAATLVLEEDGTAVDGEDFFQLLEDDSSFMVLGPGQRWSPVRGSVLAYGLGREKPRHSKDIARITFDVYKQSPRDLFGSLNVKATFYGLYSMSCDFQGLGPKKVLRELLRWASRLMQGLGQMLLGISSTLRHVIEGADQWQGQGRLHAY